MSEPSPAEAGTADFFMAALWDAAQPVTMEIPGYEILGEISRGGMGAVYHARQLRPEREVALKVLLPQFAQVPEMLARFQLEARAMATLDHPGILPVYEVGEADGTPFFSMKLATGGSLADRLDEGPMAHGEAVDLMIELTRAVHHAHQHGVLHRDLKPGNFLFMEDGRACVSDFGLAKLTLSDHRPLTRTESFFGTPHYMAPEVAAGSVADATVAGDLYGMGAVFYECLTGRRPHRDGESVAALLRAIADEPISPPTGLVPSLPSDLSIICMKALERNPQDRYATLEDFAADLERWKLGMPIKARPVGVMESAWRWAKRHPLPATLAATLVLVILTSSVLLAVALAEARQRLQRSLIEQARIERLSGSPGHRERAIAMLQEASAINDSAEIRDERSALLARPDVSTSFTVIPARESPVFPMAEDPALAWRELPDAKHWLAWHESGVVRLWDESPTTALAEWSPAEGDDVVVDFTDDGDGLILAGTGAGVVLERVSHPGNPRVVASGGSMVRFVTAEPGGRRLALARVDGLEIFNTDEPPAMVWRHGSTPARCAAAWSGDGSRVASALGDRREVLIHSAADGVVCSTVAVSGIPQHVALGECGGLLAVATDDGVISLCDTATGTTWCSFHHNAHGLSFHDGDTKLRAMGEDGSFHEWRVAMPFAFENWPETPRVKADGEVSGIAISPDGRRLLTVSAGCLGLWSVERREQIGHLLLENQRIDTRASAWWLGDSELLVQIPGGLERVSLDEQSRPGTKTRVRRPPGSTVLDVRPDGKWVMGLLDEEGNTYHELWPGGDADAAEPLAEFKQPANQAVAKHPFDGSSASLSSDGAIRLVAADSVVANLIAPKHAALVGLTFTPDGRYLIAVTRAHRVFSWDLEALRRED